MTARWMKLICTLTLAPSIAFSSTGDFSKALDLLNSAQERYVAGDFPKMHELLVKALRTYPDDPLLAKKRRSSQEFYYAKNLPDFVSLPGAMTVSIAIERHRKNREAIEYVFNLTSRALPDETIVHAEVILPNGSAVAIHGDGTSSISNVYKDPNRDTMVVHADSQALHGTSLPVGVYRFKYEIKNGKKFEIPVILWPDLENSTMPTIEADGDRKTLRWSTPLSYSSVPAPSRDVQLSLYKDSAVRPLWDKFITIMPGDPDHGVIKVDPKQEANRLVINYWEGFMHQQLSILFIHSTEMSLNSSTSGE